MIAGWLIEKWKTDRERGNEMDEWLEKWKNEMRRAGYSEDRIRRRRRILEDRLQQWCQDRTEAGDCRCIILEWERDGIAEWCAVMDDATCEECKALHGREWIHEDYPVPPLHKGETGTMGTMGFRESER